MKSLFLIITILIGTQSLSAQHTLKGKVTDQNGQPIPYVAITVVAKDKITPMLAEKITDSLGKFSVDIKPDGPYTVHLMAVGFRDGHQDVAEASEQKEINFILNSATTNLKDVSVSTKKPIIERKIDRIVMNVDNNPLATGKSSMETIGLAPGVFVRDGQIAINGNTGTRVMVDGKMLKLSGNDLTNYLNSLRSEDIQSIEVIAHPPAEYDAEGTGGLINIVLKKQKRAGLNGSIYSNYEQGRYASSSNGVQLNFKKEKLGLFASYSYDVGKGFNDINQTRTFPQQGLYTAKNRGINNDNGYRLHVGGTYDLTDKQYLGIDYTNSINSTKEVFTGSTLINYPANPGNNSISTGNFPSNYKTNYQDVGLNYHYKLDSIGSEFVFLADYTFYNAKNKNEANSAFYDGSNQFIKDTSYRNYTPSDANIFTADVKYSKAFKPGSILSIGSKISATSIHNKASFEYLGNNGWQSNSPQNFIYDYMEHITAGYINYSGKFLGTDLQIGLRGENTSLTGTLYDSVGTTKNPRSYFGLFPSIYLKRNLDSSGNNMLSFAYNRRLNRPGFFSLNPHVNYIDNYTMGRGNPYLNPEYNNSYELNYTFKNKYTLTASYSFSKDVINNAIRPDENNQELMMQQPINSGTNTIWMLMASIPLDLEKWWSMQNTIQYSNQHSKAEQYDIKANVLMVQSNQSFQLPNNYSLTLSGFYLSKILFANAVIDHLSSVSLGIQKKMFKNRLILKGSVDDIFFTNKIKGSFFYDEFRLNFDQLQPNRKFTIGLTYNFDLGKTFQARTLQNSNAEEKNRL